MILIECFGIPGSGKSTISNGLITSLSEKGFQVATYEHYKQDSNGKKLVLRGAFTHAGFSFLRNVIKSAKGTGFFTDSMRVKRTLFCLSFIGYYKTVKDYDFLVMDEGIVQGLVSALFDWDTEYDLSWLAEVLAKCRIRPVFVMTDAITSNARLVQRNTPEHGRCDGISDEKKRIEILEIQYRRFQNIYKACQMKGLSPIGIDDRVDTPAEYIKELLSIKER